MTPRDVEAMVERLEGCAEDYWGKLAIEAAAMLRALQAENERLREALSVAETRVSKMCNDFHFYGYGRGQANSTQALCEIRAALAGGTNDADG